MARPGAILNPQLTCKSFLSGGTLDTVVDVLQRVSVWLWPCSRVCSRFGGFFLHLLLLTHVFVYRDTDQRIARLEEQLQLERDRAQAAQDRAAAAERKADNPLDAAKSVVSLVETLRPLFQNASPFAPAAGALGATVDMSTTGLSTGMHAPSILMPGMHMPGMHAPGMLMPSMHMPGMHAPGMPGVHMPTSTGLSMHMLAHSVASMLGLHMAGLGGAAPGLAQTAAGFCARCGQLRRSADDKFCNKCGAPFH